MKIINDIGRETIQIILVCNATCIYKYLSIIFIIKIGITTVLTLSTIALDSRTDLPKVHYATALDWFIITCFFYCIATLLEFAGVHYFTKVSFGTDVR